MLRASAARIASPARLTSRPRRTSSWNSPQPTRLVGRGRRSAVRHSATCAPTDSEAECSVLRGGGVLGRAWRGAGFAFLVAVAGFGIFGLGLVAVGIGQRYPSVAP